MKKRLSSNSGSNCYKISINKKKIKIMNIKENVSVPIVEAIAIKYSSKWSHKHGPNVGILSQFQ